MSLNHLRNIFVSLRPWTSRPISRAYAWHVSIIWDSEAQLRGQRCVITTTSLPTCCKIEAMDQCLVFAGLEEFDEIVGKRQPPV